MLANVLDIPHIILEDFSMSSQNGFLPAEPPLRTLPDPYYAPWESIMAELPKLLLNRKLKQQVNQLPVLQTSNLLTKREWQRAYSILSFLTHAYIWGDDIPSEVSPTFSLPPYKS